MRRAKKICEKLKHYEELLLEIKKAVPPDEYNGATTYPRGIINALKWVLGDLKDV